MGTILMAAIGWNSPGSCAAGEGHYFFVCTKHNDLYRAVSNTGRQYPRVKSAVEAAEMALPGSGILILADEYPDRKVMLEKDFFFRVPL